MSSEEGRRRVVIEGVAPEIDGGRFPVKRVIGERVAVEADVFTEGRDAVTCRLLVQAPGAAGWSEVEMQPLPDDRWRGELTAGEQGRWRYTVLAWVDPFKSWRRDLRERVDAGQDVSRDLRRGADLIRAAAQRAEEAQRRADARVLAGLAGGLEDGSDLEARLQLALDDELAHLMDRHADRRFATRHRELEVVVDRERARFSTWYEMFPRSAGPGGRHGTFQDAEAWLPEVAEMGFDVLALPPISRTGSELGTPEDFRRFCAKAKEQGLEIALDLAFPCSPADFERDAWRELWQELKGSVDFWIEQGVRIFRADSPHTRPFPFWEWLIEEVKREHPDALFLAAEYARPKLMARLAKLGFTQSMTDFPSRCTRSELVGFFTELTRSGMREVLRPHLSTKLPEALTELLETGDRPAFVQRLMLAATLGASYSVCGLAFEGDDSLRELIALVNRIRRENPALQSDQGLRFHEAENGEILCYSKVDGQGDNAILVVVNLDPHNVQSAWIELPIEEIGLPADQPFQMHDLLTGARYIWHGPRNFVQLDPKSVPAHVFRVRRQVRTERDFGDSR